MNPQDQALLHQVQQQAQQAGELLAAARRALRRVSDGVGVAGLVDCERAARGATAQAHDLRAAAARLLAAARAAQPSGPSA